MVLFSGRMGQQWGLLDPAQEEEKKRQGFWQGGDKFTGRDGIAGVLAVLGDALQQQAGGQGGYADMLGSGRMSAIAMAKKQQEQQAQQEAARRRAIAAGVDPARAEMMASGDANPADWMPKGEEPTAFMRNEEYVQQRYGPEAAKAYAVPSLYGMTRGADGRMYPITPNQAPDTLTDDEWNSAQPMGGGASNGASGFPRRYRR